MLNVRILEVLPTLIWMRREEREMYVNDMSIKERYSVERDIKILEILSINRKKIVIQLYLTKNY